MLQLLVAEAYKGLERHLVAEPVIAADLENLRADVALDETEHVRVRAPLHLAHESLLALAQERVSLDQREPVRQELLREVEFASADDVPIDVPAHALRHLDAAGVALGIGARRRAIDLLDARARGHRRHRGGLRHRLNVHGCSFTRDFDVRWRSRPAGRWA